MATTEKPELLRQENRPGASASDMARMLARAERPALLGWSLGSGIVGGALAALLTGPILGVVVGLVLVLAVGRIVRRRGAAHRWRLGAKGERRTGRRLNRLRRRGWVVLHDRALSRTRANVDHLVIGPSGVYVVDSKYRNGVVRFGGKRGWIRIGKANGPLLVEPAEFETARVQRALSSVLGDEGAVVGVLAVHVPRSGFPKWRHFEALGVWIMAAESVEEWLCDQENVYSPSEVARIAEAARERLPAYRQK